MNTFIISLVALVVGYFIHGAFVEKCFGIEPAREPPATALDGRRLLLLHPDCPEGIKLSTAILSLGLFFKTIRKKEGE
ncbi:hypothetical protein [Pontiella desulfatans]|nr:hypothetical protein [Pontiella desulfatans]